MKRLVKDPAACSNPENPVLADLIYGWGNYGWSALDEYLAACIDDTLSSDGPILECGSGLSTVVVGAVAKKRGRVHWVFEHTPEWTARVRKYLERFDISSVNLRTTPLKDYGDYCWYDLPLEPMPDDFSLVICDGPPGITKGGRYGLVPVMKGRLKAGCTILLDDADREGELKIARLWGDQFGVPFEVLGSKKPYIRMTL